MGKKMEKITIMMNQLGLCFAFKKLATYIFPVWLIYNQKIRSNIWSEKCLKKLKKYLRYSTFAQENTEEICANTKERIIWILWLQGRNQMPPLVKQCFASVCKYHAKDKIVLLDQDNLHEYVQLPDMIETKYQKKFITIAQYSDLIRISLLCQHGGIWIDATVFLTGRIPDDILNEKVFFYQKSKMEYAPTMVSSWFIISKNKENDILCSIRDTLYYYWFSENHMMHPFLFHLVITSLYQNNKDFQEKWDKILYRCNMNPHLLQFTLEKEYDEKEWKYILSQSCIHKLSWKIDASNFKKNSFFEFFINLDLL